LARAENSGSDKYIPNDVARNLVVSVAKIAVVVWQTPLELALSTGWRSLDAFLSARSRRSDSLTAAITLVLAIGQSVVDLPSLSLFLTKILGCFLKIERYYESCSPKLATIESPDTWKLHRVLFWSFFK